jgi:hypothetical protein
MPNQPPHKQVRALTALFAKRKKEIHRALAENKLTDLGFVLTNRYSFNGQPSIQPWQLIGRDRLLAEALRALFPIQIVDLNLVEETNSRDDSDPDNDPYFDFYTHYRVARGAGIMDLDTYGDFITFNGIKPEWQKQDPDLCTLDDLK